MKKHFVFIINPHSGTDRNKMLESAIAEAFEGSGFSFEIQRTQHAHHGTDLARTAASEGAWAVVAVGGDGSVNDVAQGIIGTATKLGILPKGSGNGLARSLNIPLKMDPALKVLMAGKALKIDVGFANGKLFLSNAGVGFDALISRAFARSKARGLASYSKLVFRHLWRYRCPGYHIDMDGKWFVQKAFLVNVANGQQFGYDFKIAPSASVTDGLFDVVIIRPFPRLKAAILLWRAWKGTLPESPYVTHHRAKKVTVRHPGLRLMQTDGDGHSCDEVATFELKEKALEVLVPR